MTIVYPGIKHDARWWHGQTSICGACKQIVVLDREDNDRCEWVEHYPHRLAYVCQNCHNTVTVLREVRP